jgi:hypothetical protein
MPFERLKSTGHALHLGSLASVPRPLVELRYHSWRCPPAWKCLPAERLNDSIGVEYANTARALLERPCGAIRAQGKVTYDQVSSFEVASVSPVCTVIVLVSPGTPPISRSFRGWIVVLGMSVIHRVPGGIE